MKINFLIRLFLPGVLFFNFSCSNFDSLSLEEKMMGKWETQDGLSKYTFYRGNYILEDAIDGTLYGDWFIKDSTLYMDPGNGIVLKDDIKQLDEDNLVKSYVEDGNTHTISFKRKEMFKNESALIAEGSVKFASASVCKMLIGNWKFNDSNDYLLTFNDKNEYREYRLGEKLVTGKWFVYNDCIYFQPSDDPYRLLKDELLEVSSSKLSIKYPVKGGTLTDNFTKDVENKEPFPIK